MKKILSLVLAIMMVLSMASTAFAGTFEDVSDATQAKAIDALVSLGIVKGYDDGTYKPEKVVTRAEMAKMLIVALGYESIANDTPAFTDSQNHWAKGYIALASDLGVVNGRGNGIFDPDATVTYQEAAVMMLRALGYTDQAINNGKSEAYNAGNYKTKALALGLFDSLKSFAFNSGANRGDIASMLFVNLTNNMVEIVPTTGLASSTGETLLVKSGLATRDSSYTVTVARANAGFTADLKPYLGETLVVYKTLNDVIFVEKAVTGAFTGAFDDSATATKVYINDAEYTLTSAAGVIDAGITVIINGKAEAGKTVTDINTIDGKLGSSVKVVYDKTSKAVKALVFEEVTRTKRIANVYVEGKTKLDGIELPLDDAGKVDFDALTVKGDVDSINDIAKKDIVQVCAASDNSSVTLYVTRQTVEGQVSKVSGTTFYINGTGYKLNTALAAAANGVALRAQGTFSLDKDGRIVFFAPTSVETNYAIVTGFANGSYSTSFGTKTIASYPKLQMMDMEGNTKAYELGVYFYNGTFNGITGVTANDTTANVITIASRDYERAGNRIAAAQVAPGTLQGAYLVEYSVDSNGRITSIAAVDFDDVNASIAKTSANFLAGDNTIVVNYNSANNTCSITTLANIASTVNVKAVGNGFVWDLVIVTDGITVNDGNYAIITSVSDILNAKGTAVQEVTAFLNGEKIVYLTSSASTTYADKKYVLSNLKINSDNVITGFATTQPTATITATPTAIVGNRVMLEGESSSRLLNNNVVVYKIAYNAYGQTVVTVEDISEIQYYANECKVSLYDLNANTSGFEVVIIDIR